jgi:putative transcriptional regulator
MIVNLTQNAPVEYSYGASSECFVREENRVEQLRVTQGEGVELGDHLNVSRQTIHAIEPGRCDPSLSLALVIAKLFGRSVEQIFGKDNSVDPVKEGKRQKATT